MVEINPAYGPGQPTTTRSSPALETAYVPSETRPVTVAASLDLKVAIGKSAEVQLQVSFDGTDYLVGDRRKMSTTGSVAEVLGVTPALTMTITEGVLLLTNVPAGCKYRLMKTAGEGTVTINSVTETVM